MKLYLHLDRSEKLQTGDIIYKEPYYDESLLKSMTFIEPEFLKHLEQLCHDGLSLHGAKYLIRLNGNMHIQSFLIELYYEYIRYKYYENLPSRLQSFFAFRDYKQALTFAQEKGSKGKIYEIVADNKCFMGDMNLLKTDLDTEKQEQYARNYWESRRLSTDPEYMPIWECLLNLPVEIGKEALINPLDL